VPWKESDKKPTEDENPQTHPSEPRDRVSMGGPILICFIYAILSSSMAIGFVFSGDGIPKDAAGMALVRASFKVLAIYCSVVVLMVFVLFAFRRRAVRIAALLGSVTPWALLLLTLAAFGDSSPTMLALLMICASFPILLIVGEHISSLVRRLRAWWF
jgi:hypothetical protein